MKNLEKEINDISKISFSSSQLSLNPNITTFENKSIISYLIYLNNTNKEIKDIEKIIKKNKNNLIEEDSFNKEIFKSIISNIIKLNRSENPSKILNNILYNLSGNVFNIFELNSSSLLINLLNYYISIYFVKIKQDYSNLINLFNSLQLINNQEDEESSSLQNSIISTNCNSINKKNKKPKIIKELIEISKNEHLKNIKIFKIVLPDNSINKLIFYNYIFFYLNSIWLLKLIEELEINLSNFYYFKLKNNNNIFQKDVLIYLLILDIFYYLNYLLSNFKKLKRFKLIIPFSFHEEISKSFKSDLYKIQCLLNNKKYESKSVSTNSCVQIDILDILNFSFKNYNKNFLFYIEFNSFDSYLFKKVNEIIKNNNFENLTIVFFPLNNQENIYENYNIYNENIYYNFEKNLSELLDIFNEIEIIYYLVLQFEIPLKFINTKVNKIDYNKCIIDFIHNIKNNNKFSNIKLEILSKTLNMNLTNY